MLSNMDKHREHRRNIIWSISAGNHSIEDAVKLVQQNPMFASIRDAPELFKPMFSRTGTGGILAIWAIDTIILYELATKEKRQSADFADLIEQAKNDFNLFKGLKIVAAMDLKRPGQPNEHLRQWAAELLENNFPAPKKPRKGKIAHLAWRDALVATLFADAFVFGFPEYKNTKSKPGQGKDATCDIVVKALEDVLVITPDTVEGIWTKNKDRIIWSLPEIPENLS